MQGSDFHVSLITLMFHKTVNQFLKMRRNLKKLEALKKFEVFSDWLYSIIILFMMTLVEMKSC